MAEMGQVSPWPHDRPDCTRFLTLQEQRKSAGCVFFLFQAPAYNRHNLPTNTSEKQAQEILIRRQHSLRQSYRKGNSLPWAKPVNTTEVRYLSLPQGPSQRTRQKARHVTFTDHHRSGSDTAFPVMFRPQPRLRPFEAKHRQEELIPMAHLDRRVRPSNPSGRRGNSIRQHHFTRAENLALMPKSRFTVGEVKGYESEEETVKMAPAKPLDIWGAEKSNVCISRAFCALHQRR